MDTKALENWKVTRAANGYLVESITEPDVKVIVRDKRDVYNELMSSLDDALDEGDKWRVTIRISKYKR